MAKKPKNRFFKLAGMTASIAGKAMTNGIKSINSDEEQKAQRRAELMKEVGIQIADTLGEMKGAVMKVGQIASQYKDVFPPEVAKALEKLQRSAPPMPFDVIKKQIEKELGKPIDELYASFEETAFAAASIGQVHKATLLSGEKVVVKVQYPNVDESCESDLKQVRMALRLTGVLKIDKDLQNAIFEEMQHSLYDELDYTKEAHNLEVFGTFHQQVDTGLIIPSVYKSHSSRRVLTLSEEMGESIETASTWSDDIKTTIADRLYLMTASQLFFLRRIHSDPHAGNFAFRENGDVVVYDFGSTRTYSEEDVKHFQMLARHGFKGDVTALEQDLISLGLRRDNDKTVPGEFYQQWLDIMLPAIVKNELFDFGQSTVHLQIVEQLKVSMKYWDCFHPSATTMMAERTIAGVYWNLVSLKAKANFYDVSKQYFEGELSVAMS